MGKNGNRGLSINDIKALVVLAAVSLVLIWVFWNQIVSAFVHAAVTAVSVVIVLILAALPLAAGFFLARYLYENGYINEGSAAWATIAACFVGLYLLASFPLGHSINVALTLFVFGILGLFGLNMLEDITSWQSGTYFGH